MRRLSFSLLALALLTLAAPAPSVGQIHVEANGNLGYSLVNTLDWLGEGAFDVERPVYGGDVAVIFGRRYGRGLQLALDFGFQHLLSYQFIQQGQPEPFNAEVYRGSLTTRFWFQEGTWFGEAGFGAYRFSGRTDPALHGGFGTLFEISDRLAIPVRARGAVVFGSRSQIGPVWLSTGLSYRLRN